MTPFFLFNVFYFAILFYVWFLFFICFWLFHFQSFIFMNPYCICIVWTNAWSPICYPAEKSLCPFMHVGKFGHLCHTMYQYLYLTQHVHIQRVAIHIILTLPYNSYSSCVSFNCLVPIDSYVVAHSWIYNLMTSLATQGRFFHWCAIFQCCVSYAIWFCDTLDYVDGASLALPVQWRNLSLPWTSAWISL